MHIFIGAYIHTLFQLHNCKVPSCVRVCIQLYSPLHSCIVHILFILLVYVYSLFQTLWGVGNSSAVHATADGLVLAALVDGQVMVFNVANKTRFFFQPDKMCSGEEGRHGDIVDMCSLSGSQLLVIGFACGKIHVYNWQENLHDCLLSHQDHHCTQLTNNFTIHSLICFSGTSSAGDVLSMWFGTSSSTVVVWDYALTPDLHWGHDEIEKVESAVPVCAEGNLSMSKEFTAKTLKLSADKSCVVALLHQRGSQVSSLAVIDAVAKTLLRYVICSMEGTIRVLFM